MQTTSPGSRRIRLWLAFVLVAGAALRLYDLGGPSTWVDELYRVVWAKGYELNRFFGFLPAETGARLPPRDLAQAVALVNGHIPPLYPIILNAWMQVVGSESDFAVRLPSAVLGVLSILGMFLAARQLLGPAIGAWAATLVALSPFHVFYSQEANHYALGPCLVVFSFWFYLRWAERPGAASGVGLAATGLAALYTHYYAAIALAFQAVELAVRHRREPRRLLVAALPYLAIAVGFAPYLRALSRQLRELTDPANVGTFQGAGYFAERMQAIAVLPWLGDRGEYLPPLLGLPIAALVIGLFVAGLRTVGDGAIRRVLLLNALGPLVLVAVVFWVAKSNSILWPRYQIFFTFALFIPVAAALHGLRWWRWVAAPALAALAATGLHFMFAELVKEDWEGAAAAIASRGSSGDPVVVYRPNLVYALGRYLPSDHRLFGVEAGAGLPRQLAAATGGAQSVWFVSAWAQNHELPTTVHELLACGYARREDHPVPSGRVGLTVTRYSEPRGSPVALASAGGDRTTACGTAALGDAVREWERAVAGPALEAGWIDAPAPLEELTGARSVTVSGWAFSTRGVRALVFELDGREVKRTRHVGLARPDVAAANPAAPASHTLNAGFWGVVDLGSTTPGVHSLVVSAVHEDGTTRRIGERELRLLVGPTPWGAAGHPRDDPRTSQ